jgi:hypothetical protein
VKDEDLVQKIKDKFDRDQGYWSSIYDEAKRDMMFLSGEPDAQWVGLKKPIGTALTIDRLSSVVNQIANDIRMNTPAIKVIPGDRESSEDVAEILSGLIKNIEYESMADSVYDSAALSSVRCGIGFMRIETEYEDDTSFNQKICIKRVANPLSVYIDCTSVEADGSDMKHATILQEILVSDFKEDYPNFDPSSFKEGGIERQYKDEDSIFIAEHFYIENKKEELVSPDDETMRRPVVRKIIHRVLVSGKDLLEKTTFPGDYIPVVPVFGEEYWVEGKRYLASAIRRAKDPQRMYNYWRSVETSLLMKQQIAPTMVAEGQISGFEDEWKNPNSLVVQYKLLDATGNAYPSPQRLPPPQIPSGIVNAALTMAEDIKATTGIFDASLGNKSNETSGIAIQRRQQEGDTATFHFADNLTKAISYAGRVIVSAIPKIYDTARILNVMDLEGNVKKVGVNGEITEDQQEDVDLTRGRYTVKVTTGPSFTTKRQESADFFGKIAQSQPEMMQIVGDLVFKYMDLPGAEALSERIKKTMDPRLLDEENDPMAAQYQQQMEAMQQQLQAAAQEMQAMQQQLDNKQADTQIKVQSEQNKVEIESAKLTLQQSEMETDAQLKQQELEIKFKELEIKEQELMIRLEELRMQKELKELEIMTNNFNAQNQEDESGEMKKEDEGDNGSRDLELALLQGNSAAIQGITNLMQSKKNITINRDANGLMESLTVM